MPATSREASRAEAAKVAADGRALKARLVERLTAHLTTRREALERFKLEDLLTIAAGIINPVGHS